MQNYQQLPGYQRPGSTASFAGQPAPPPPPPGAPPGYQSTASTTNPQWAAPVQTTAQPQQQWNQTSQQGSWGQQPAPQAAGGYNPGTYGPMPGTYGQTQQHDIPPPPPPKPEGYPSTVQSQPQQASQSWGQQSVFGGHQGQQNVGFASQGQQGGYPQQQSGFQSQGTQPQLYNTAAPPPPSQTPGGSYFPPPQGRPTSVYGADQAGAYSTPQSAVSQQPPNTVLSPNEQHPAYIPPSLTGQGVQSYMPTNTNPLPGVYVPPPPDIPAWQQASHAPLQGATKKFRYTKPTVDQSFYSQGYQPPQQPQFAQQPMQAPQPQNAQLPYGQPAQHQYQQQGQMQPGQFVHPNQPLTQQFDHSTQQQNQFQQPQQAPQPSPYPPQYGQAPQDQPIQQPVQQYQQQGSQWQQPPPADQGYGQPQPSAPASYVEQQPVPQSGWQPAHQAHGSIGSQEYSQGQDSSIQAPTPIGRTGTTPPNFVNNISPQSQPVSPVQNRHSISLGTGNLGRTSSVSSIALGAIRNSQAQTITKASSPAPATPQKVPTPPPPRDPASKFSALGSGGPSDWERFGDIDEEIDDEDIFGVKKEEKDTPAQPDSVELPASHPSPPSTTAEWPTPLARAAEPAPLNAGIQRRDTYQPTPPPTAATPVQGPPSQPPQQTFVMGDAIISAQSPEPTHTSQSLPSQQGFVMNDGGWVPSKQGAPAQQQQQYSPPAQQGFVMDDGGWAAQAQPGRQTPTEARQQTPGQQQQPPPTNTFVMGDAGWGAATQQVDHQASHTRSLQAQNETHLAELKAKDEAYERLRVDTERDKADLRALIEVLKTDIESIKNHAATDKNVLNEQMQSLKATADQAKANTDAIAKEKDSVIERLKEDAEGKDDCIKERDAMIADLKLQLEVEKSKELPKPTAADLIPDINPWYIGSLERYIGMLRGEADEPQVEDKIKVFTSFLRTESEIRGLEYYSAPPGPPVQEHVVSPPTEQFIGMSPEVSDTPAAKPDMHVQVPQESSDQDTLYSPGGRPLMQRKPTLISNDTHTATSNQSTTILTPTSSTDDDFNKTPIQSPPEEVPQPQYKAYVPPVAAANPIELSHRQSLSFATPPSIPGVQVKGHKSDEIFFGDPEPTPKPPSRPTSRDSTVSDVQVPAPLSFASHPPITKSAPKAAPNKNSLEVLANLLPKHISPTQPNAQLEDIRRQSQALHSDFSYIIELTTKWEKAVALTRRKNEIARQKRQEESETKTDELFNDNEISYADIGAIEDEFKENERKLKAQEDRDEYKSYVEDVFDKVYDGLQADIKSLMDLYVETEALLHSSISGAQAIEGAEIPTKKDTLELLKELHTAIELRHEKVAVAVSERDKRYKKTEVQPLYAANNIPKMKQVEKHFENAEKQAVVRAKDEKADRIGELVKVAEEAVVAAVKVEQEEAVKIIAAIKELDESEVNGREEVLSRARETLSKFRASSKALLTLFNALEMELNNSVLDAEIAQARAEGADAAKITHLEQEMGEGEKRFKEELIRKIGVLEQDTEEVEKLFEDKGSKKGLTEEEEKKRRMKAALEEAKRRNGEL